MRAMQETPQQYTERILGYSAGKEPLRLQEAAPKKLAALVKGKKKQQLTRRPAPGKWSVAEILAHLADAEIVIAWRLRQVLASNGVPLQAYDQDVWATTFGYAKRDPKQSLESFRIVRQGNLALLKAAPKEAWDNYGQHQERGNETVSHIVRMVAGHDLNHLQQVEGILRGKR